MLGPNRVPEPVLRCPSEIEGQRNSVTVIKYISERFCISLSQFYDPRKRPVNLEYVISHVVLQAKSCKLIHPFM
jgi:hypothetical protein